MAEANHIVLSSEVLYEKLLYIESVVVMALQVSGERDVRWIDVMRPLVEEVLLLADAHHGACFRVGPMLTYLQTGITPDGGV